MDMAEAVLPPVVAGHWSSEAGREMAAQYAAMTRDQLGSATETDFQLANSVFMVGRSDLSLIHYQTAAKERIRWLSVQLALAEAALVKIADGSVPPDQHGHYLAHRECVRIARAVLRQQPQASPGNRKDGEAQS